MHPKKRREARAVLDEDGVYRASGPLPTPTPNSLLPSLASEAGSSAVLAGFDFAIGVPAAYARAAGITSFLETLPSFGGGVWHEFFEVARAAGEISSTRPFYPHSAPNKGAVSHARLCAGLGVSGMDELRRECDLATRDRAAAEVIFWTLGRKQVGKGVITGWRDMLQPAQKSIGEPLRIWPFDGKLDELLRPGRVVVAETYPAEFYGHFGVTVSKTEQSSRRAAAGPLFSWVRAAGLRLTSSLEAALLDGFGPSSDGEDDFDAVVGLFGMLNVVLGYRTTGEPADAKIGTVEGWMFGLSGASRPRPSLPAQPTL